MKKRRNVQMEESSARFQMEEIAGRVKQIRGEQSIQEVVTELELLGIPVSRSNYRRMEEGTIMFHEDVLLGLSKIFGVSFEFIFTGKTYAENHCEDMDDIIKKLEKSMEDIRIWIKILHHNHHH